MPKITFISRKGATRTVEAAEGATLMETIKGYDEDMEGACGGVMACATCHVIVDEGWYAKLPKPSREELDMLELATGVRRTSRLACQIKLTAALEGLKVALPPAS